MPDEHNLCNGFRVELREAGGWRLVEEYSADRYLEALQEYRLQTTSTYKARLTSVRETVLLESV